MTNILKYKSYRGTQIHAICRSKRAGDGISWSKRQMRKELRRIFKKVGEETGCHALVAGTRWV